MSNLPDTVKESRENIESYVQQRLRLIQLEMVEKAATLSASFVKSVVFVTLAGSFFLLINLGLSLYLNEVLQSGFWGFFIVAGAYLVLGLLLYVLRKPLLSVPIQNRVVREMLAEDEPQNTPTDGTEKDQ